MGDQYHINGGQILNVGPYGIQRGNTLNNFNELSGLDLQVLAKELSELKQALRTSSGTLEHDEAVVEIGRAERAALQGDAPTIVKHLGQAGRWAFDVATKIGVAVAAKAIGNSLGQSG